MPILKGPEGDSGASFPASIAILRRGLSRVLASYYIGIGTTFFDQLVAEGKLPPPVKIGARRVWDRHELDVAFDSLKELETVSEPNPWDL